MTTSATTLLLIDTSPRKDAVSRELTNRFVEAWSTASRKARSSTATSAPIRRSTWTTN